MIYLPYEDMAAVPTKWKGSAMLCPEGHQMHLIRYGYAENCYKDAHCKGGCGWIDLSKFSLDETEKTRTEGRKATEDQNEPVGETE